MIHMNLSPNEFVSRYPVITEPLVEKSVDVILPNLRYKNRNIYWLWRYRHRSGRQKDMYLGKGLDRSIAKVRSIGIPKDAAAKRLNKGRKLWAISPN
jgi:hypothetical protein